MVANNIDERISEFAARTQKMTGKEVREREPWNTEASADAIRHFAYGIDDGNPLWLDPAYAATTAYKKLLAPPAFLVSVLYPILHGAPMEVPLSSLIGGVEFEWYLPVFVGDRLHASSRQVDTYEKKSRSGRRLIFVISECTYCNQDDAVVAKATGTMIRATQVTDELLFDRPIYRYNDTELEKIDKASKAEKRTGTQTLCWEDIAVGQEIPCIVRGPLTIGDMVCWNAGIGPSYKAGRMGYLDLLKAPHAGVRNPVTGWQVKYSQQHEDFHLASQRGMPAPFDNGVMRFAWVSPLLTNWMGDAGILRKLNVQVRTPNIYGDTTWYHGTVVDKVHGTTRAAVTIKITGINQVGITTTTGTAEVILPSRGAQA
ncbi:MAG: MaoC family dehydratase N-terminal domain-containing protein [Candidatus Binatia bacterium]